MNGAGAKRGGDGRHTGARGKRSCARAPATLVIRAACLALPALAPLAAARSGFAQQPPTFIEVAIDEETRRADGKLRRYFEDATGLAFVAERPLEYDAVIVRIVNWDRTKGDFVARITPYAMVAAELLGADLEVIGTYVSKATGGTTYHSYFVVGRERFPYAPEISSVAEYLRGLGRPGVFAYHTQFSTSSYFLPALYFRERGIFNMPESTEHHTAIHSLKVGAGSSDLVKGVARGEYDLAAVWDGTKARFESTDSLGQRYGSRVRFIQLPTTLPNDLLVASASIDSAVLARIRQAIDTMAPDQIDVGDFLSWRGIHAAPEAREALANLRWLARERPAPMTVDVRGAAPLATPVSEEYLEAARQAVRLAGAEFVNYDGDYHANRDYLWTLEPIHDGAITLTSRITGSEIEDQEFQISFRDAEDLTRRVGTIIQSRLHRIRYVWPYRTEHPTVIRDVSFSLPPGADVKVRRINWLDVRRNLFLEDAEFDARVAQADFFKFELEPAFIADAGDAFGFDPMSNVSYRVILVRKAEERAVFRVLTVVLLALLVAAGGAAIIDLRRRPISPPR